MLLLPLPKGTRILVVEDSPADQEALFLTMGALGMDNEVNVVEDGEECLAYLSGKAPYDNRDEFPLPGIIFLDINLPRLNGIEVLKTMRAMPEHKQTPVIVLTASDADRDVLAAFALDALFYMEKPVREENLSELFDLD